MILHFIILMTLSLGAHAGSEAACSFNQGNCQVRHGFVQDYGYGGFTSTLATAARVATNPIGTAIDVVRNGGPPNPECVLNPMTPVTTGAATLVNGNATDATRAELEAIQCAGEAGRAYSFTGNFQEILNTVADLDPLQEELIFLTATEDIHNFNECQNGLFNSFLTNPEIKNDMLSNAWRQFQDITSSNEVIPRLREEYRRRSDVSRADSITGCIRDNCPTPSADDIRRIRERSDNQRRVEALRPEINLLISRIPMANRDSMRAQMENLLMSNEPVTEARFKEVYEQEMNRMNAGVQESREFIRGITVMAGEKRLFCVDRNLKENLYRSGQVDHTIERMGLTDVLGNFSLRSQNRYGLAGTVVTEVAMIPTYFVGYGFARLALRAGASSVRAVSMGGRALASSTRLAMLGLEAADYSAAIAAALRDCDSDNFQARVDGQACNPADEIGLAYEEASLAQCITSAILPMASPLIGSGVRVVQSRRLQQLYDNTPAQVDEIVVTGRRQRPERSRELGAERTSELLSPYFNLRRKIRSLGNGDQLPVAPQITSADQIPYEQSGGFRAVQDPEVMRQRARELDPEISGAITGAYNALNDRTALRAYYQELYTDAALWMRHRGRPEDLARLRRGEVSEHAIAVVLVRRAKDRGDANFTTILRDRQTGESRLATGRIPTENQLMDTDNQRFRMAVRTGPFFDHGFEQGMPEMHGPWAHMIQREIVLENVSRATNGNPQRFYDFLGTPRGINFWADLFDSGSNTSMTSPEVLNGFMLRNMAPPPPPPSPAR